MQIQPASLESISAQATLIAGEWPGPPQHGGPLPVALPAAEAGRLHLTLGSVLTGTPQPSGAPISLRVTGLFRPKDPASPYWTLVVLPLGPAVALALVTAAVPVAVAALSVLRKPDPAAQLRAEGG